MYNKKRNLKSSWRCVLFGYWYGTTASHKIKVIQLKKCKIIILNILFKLKCATIHQKWIKSITGAVSNVSSVIKISFMSLESPNNVKSQLFRNERTSSPPPQKEYAKLKKHKLIFYSCDLFVQYSKIVWNGDGLTHLWRLNKSAIKKTKKRKIKSTKRGVS